MNDDKNIINLLIKNITLDVALGYLILVIMTPTIPFNSPENVIVYYRIWFIACAIMGMTNIIYENKKLSVLASSIIHILLTISIIVITLHKTLTLIDYNIVNTFYFTIIGIALALLIFAICWILSYLKEVRNLKNINNKLKE
ncbi:MAG: DUF3021 family protein [Lachnospirales bacterium]